MSDDAEPITIEQLNPSAIETLRRGWLAMRDHHAAIAVAETGPPRSDEDAWARAKLAFTTSIGQAGGFCLAAYVPSLPFEPAGFAIVTMLDPSPMFEQEPRGRINVLAVLPEHRSRGIGALLIRAAEAQLVRQSADLVELHVLATNDRGIAFYASEGYDPVFHVVRRRARPG